MRARTLPARPGPEPASALAAIVARHTPASAGVLSLQRAASNHAVARLLAGDRRAPTTPIVQRLIGHDDFRSQAGAEKQQRNVLGFKRQMSSRYTTVLAALEQYHLMAGRLCVGSDDGADLTLQLTALKRAADTYVSRHTTQDKGRLHAFRFLLTDIATEFRALSAINDRLDELDGETFSDAVRAIRDSWNVTVTTSVPSDEEVTVGAEIAKGGLGAIYGVEGRENRTVKKPQVTLGFGQRGFLQELDRQLEVPHHPNVMKVFGRATGPGGRVEGALLKYIRGGTLRRALTQLKRGYESGRLKPEWHVGVLQWIAADVFAGLAHLHAAGVVHGDVHSGNVVLGHVQGRAKLIDYAAVPVGQKLPIAHAYGGYAPEAAALYPDRYTRTTGRLGQDVWTPSDARTPAAATMKIHQQGGAQALDVHRAGRLVTEPLEELSDKDAAAIGDVWEQAQDFARLTARPPGQRPSAEQLLGHEYLSPAKRLIDRDLYTEVMWALGTGVDEPAHRRGRS